MNCLSCGSQIVNEKINIASDIAQCSNCNQVFKISENLTSSDDGFDVNKPPKGAWYMRTMDGITAGASTRSPIAFFLVPFMCVWSGGSIGGIYGTQIISGEFSWIMSLFGIPFLLGSLFFWSIALMAIFGKVEVKLTKQGGRVFTGIGGLGIKKSFLWEEISSITEGVSQIKHTGSQGFSINMEGKKCITFGSGLRDGRRYFVFKVLKNVLFKVKNKQSFV